MKMFCIVLSLFMYLDVSRACTAGEAEGYDGECVTLTSEGTLGVCWGIFPDGRGPEMYASSNNPGGTYAEKQIACAEACLSRQSVDANKTYALSWDYIIDSTNKPRTEAWSKAVGFSMHRNGRCWCEMVPFEDCTGVDRVGAGAIEVLSFSCDTGKFHFINSVGGGGSCDTKSKR